MTATTVAEALAAVAPAMTAKPQPPKRRNGELFSPRVKPAVLPCADSLDRQMRTECAQMVRMWDRPACVLQRGRFLNRVDLPDSVRSLLNWRDELGGVDETTMRQGLVLALVWERRAERESAEVRRAAVVQREADRLAAIETGIEAARAAEVRRLAMVNDPRPLKLAMIEVSLPVSSSTWEAVEQRRRALVASVCGAGQREALVVRLRRYPGVAEFVFTPRLGPDSRPGLVTRVERALVIAERKLAAYRSAEVAATKL